MEFCKRYDFLRIIPRTKDRILWTWLNENGTTFHVTQNESAVSHGCVVELMNILVAAATILVAICLIFKYKCSRDHGVTRTFLPLHVMRSVLCLILLTVLLVELCESFLVSLSLTTILTVVAVLCCWTVHRETEMRNGIGTAATGGSFAVIGLARAWRLLCMRRFGLTFEHVRVPTTAIAAMCCACLALVDIYALYRVVRRSRRYTVRQLGNSHASYKHSTSTFLGKITFSWVTGIFLRGYNTPLDIEDLGDLPPKESAKYQFEHFRKIYEKAKATNRKGKISLWGCYWRRIWVGFVAGGILKFFGDVTTLIGPMAISKIIHYIYVAQNSTDNGEILYSTNLMTFSHLWENGYVLGVGVFFATILQSTLSQASTHIVSVEGIRLRTALQTLIYDKALRLYSWSIVEDEKPPDKGKKDQHRLRQVADIGTLTNLMAEDAHNVMSFFWIGHYIWAIPLKISAIIFLLYSKLGSSAIIGAVGCILVVTPIQLMLGKQMSENSKEIAEKSDARLRQLNEILQGIRPIKLRAAESLFENRVRKTRDEELKLLDKDSVYWAFVNFLTHASSVLMTLLTFGIYFWLEERSSFDAGSIFVSLALFSQLTVPLSIFPVTVPIIINAIISTKRLEEFLQLPEVVDILPGVNSIAFDAVEDCPSNTSSFLDNYTDPVNVHSVTTFGSLDNIEEDEEDRYSNISSGCYLKMTCSVDTVFEKDPETPDFVVNIESALFSWGTEENQLFVEDVGFVRGQLSLIVGKTGSGKTSLLLAMLGEIQKISGTVRWKKGLRIAYVPQKPWLLNTTLRDNILFGTTYRPRRYRNILRACALQPDVDILPGGDLTVIGEKGINLSGGQKQRIAIARAIYSDADIVIMDDPLSALDQQVGRQIFDSALRKLLLRSGRTIIMITHKLELLPTAHKIVVMDGCRVRAIGTKSSIEEADGQLADEWKRAATRQDSESKIQKTAKERWSLIRLISRIGIDVCNRHTSEGLWITDKEANVSPPAFVPLRMRRSTLSGSRYLTHDLTDLPVAAEECIAVRKSSKSHRAARSCSLQTHRRVAPVLRQNSTPTIVERNYIPPRKRHNTVDNGLRTRVLGHIFSGRIINTGTHEDPGVNGEKCVLQRLMSTNPKGNQIYENSRTPARRLLSCEFSKADELDEVEEKDNYSKEYSEVKHQEDDDSSRVTNRTWADYPKAGGCIACFTFVGSALVCQALRVYTDLWLSGWSHRDTLLSYNKNQDASFYFEIYILLCVGSVLLSLVHNAIGQWAGAKARRKLHEEAVSRLLQTRMSFFEHNPIGKVLNRFSADIGVIDKKISTSIQRLTLFVLLCGSGILVNVIVTPWFLVPAAPICGAYYFLQKFYRRSARQLQRLDGSTRGPVAAHFAETLSGVSTLRASKQETRFMDQTINHLDANINAFLMLNSSTRWLGIALDYLSAVILVIAIFTALISAELYPTRVTPALVGLAINYTLLVPIYLNWVVKFTAEIEMYMGSVARISAYRNAPCENYGKADFAIPESWPRSGEIIFENVSLRYEGQTETVVSNLSLKIPPGQKLGVCGRTGSGKSSMVMALFHMIEVSQGRVLIDQVDLRQVSLETLRSRLSIMPQDVIMFSGTIRENLDPFSEFNDEELWDALELAQMKDVVSSHPDGLNFEVREGGENFSTGQLQLLCIASVLLRRSLIVVLDEASSALDAATEKAMLKAATTAFNDKTVITIAHRAAALLNCDRVVVFDGGKIVEDGTPEELMQQTAGFFSTMLKTGEDDEEKKYT